VATDLNRSVDGEGDRRLEEVLRLVRLRRFGEFAFESIDIPRDSDGGDTAAAMIDDGCV